MWKTWSGNLYRCKSRWLSLMRTPLSVVAEGLKPDGHWAATWEEIEARFDGQAGGRRALLTSKLLALRDGLRSAGVTGRMSLDGSYVSAKSEPGDFDVLVVGP